MDLTITSSFKQLELNEFRLDRYADDDYLIYIEQATKSTVIMNMTTGNSIRYAGIDQNIKKWQSLVDPIKIHRFVIPKGDKSNQIITSFLNELEMIIIYSATMITFLSTGEKHIADIPATQIREMIIYGKAPNAKIVLFKEYPKSIIIYSLLFGDKKLDVEKTCEQLGFYYNTEEIYGQWIQMYNEQTHVPEFFNIDKAKKFKELCIKRFITHELVIVYNPDKKQLCPILRKIVFSNDECAICSDTIEDRIGIVPCGHTNVCSKCIEQLSECPNCRGKITQKLKLYM